jgi:hypothetical protein
MQSSTAWQEPIINELVDFVRQCLAAGYSRAQISDVLQQAGWAEDEVRTALSRFADLGFPIPVPRRTQAGSARDAFLYLVTFAALYTSSVAFGALLFGLVDHFFPDPIADRYAYGSGAEGLRWSIAALIVAFPIYIGLTRKHLRDYVLDPERRSSSVRRWITYLTLFVAASVVIGDMIDLVGNVLGGEIALRFLLKVVIVLGIAGGVFAFYLWEMRSADRGEPQ